MPTPFSILRTHMYAYMCMCVSVYTCTHTHRTRPQEQMTENSVVLELEYLKNEMKEYSAGSVK